jgi:hypothetical protein
VGGIVHVQNCLSNDFRLININGSNPFLKTSSMLDANLSIASRGDVVCFIGGVRYPLSVGDSLLFDAGIPHRWENTHSQSSRLLVLFCPMDTHDHPIEQHLGH